MRTAIVTTSYPSFKGDPSGHFVQAEARETGGHVLVIAPSVQPWGGAPCFEREQGEVHVLRLPASHAFGWPGFATRLRRNPWRLLAAMRWMRDAERAIDDNGPFDRIAAHWALPSAWPIVCRSHDHAELEVVSHGGDIRLLLRLPRPLRASLVRRIQRRATLWRFVSSSLLEQLLGALTHEDARSVEAVASVRACSFDLPDVKDAIAVKRAENAGARLYVSATRLVASKRIHRVIEHVASLPATAKPMRLVVVGDGPERQRLERLARVRGVDARFVGFVGRHDALAWIGAADAVVHASRAEGLSTVLREAAALGVRVQAID